MDGYNATVFAYGATGCGKTHTITGTSQDPGIIFMTMQELFEKIHERSEDKVTELSLSYLEIYNETIRDLLVAGGSKQGLNLREDANQAVSVPGLTSHHPKDVQEVMDMIVQGNEYRTVSPTEANAVSSRSHAVLQINVAMKDRNADVNEPHTMATLSIIDLAGSERASATKNRGERLMEGANINKSLLALGSCINALCDPRKRNHVPYRNSKLTRLLKFSLGGNCKTVMIVCVSPSSAHFDETQNTLRYANRAKNIQTKVTRNVFNVNRHVKDFLVKIDEQMALINELKAQQRDAESRFLQKWGRQHEKREATVREAVARLRVAFEKAEPERREKVANMKRQRAVERRIGLLSSWVAAFDGVSDARNGDGDGDGDGDDNHAMPANLAALRKTTQGVLMELEASRQHLHQKLERCNWERALDSALQHGLSQLAAGGGTSSSGAERDTLVREAELLRSEFARDAYHELLEHDRPGDTAVVQPLLASQFDVVASLADTLDMGADEAVAHAKGIINRLLEVGYAAASNAVKPDGSLMPAEVFPPTRRGTPKRKKSTSLHVKAVPAQPALAGQVTATQALAASSPVKPSPRRRKAAVARKGVSVSFTPVRKKSPSRRSVRWRDDETEEGTLADFEKTPQTREETPARVAVSSPDKSLSLRLPAAPAYLQLHQQASETDSSPSTLTLPDVASLPLPTAKAANRFQAGFLAKARASPSSDGEDRNAPLRSIPVGRAANVLSSSQSQSQASPKLSTLSLSSSLGRLSTLDENKAPSHVSLPASASCSDSESSAIDAQSLRSALHSAKRRDRRIPSTSATSIGTGLGPGPGPVATTSNGKRRVSSAAPPSAANGVTRHRRGSSEHAHRRRSPAMSCSPPDHHASSAGPPGGSVGRAFTAGQARRMKVGGSLRASVAESSPEARRITMARPGSAAIVWR